MGALRTLTPDEHIQALRILLRGADYVRATPATLAQSRGLAIILGSLLKIYYPTTKERDLVRHRAIAELLEIENLETFNDLNSTQCATLLSYFSDLINQGNAATAAEILTRLERISQISAVEREIRV